VLIYSNKHSTEGLTESVDGVGAEGRES